MEHSPVPTLASRSLSFPLVRGARRALAFSTLCASATITACGGGGGGDGGGTTTGPTGTRASVTVASQVLLASGTTGASLQITPAYERTSGDPVALAGQTVAVTGTSQNATLTVDLAGCLADASHSGGTSCNVRATVSLLAGDGRVLDTQVVGPVALAGGATTTQSVRLAEVASVRVTAPAVGGDGRAQVQMGAATTATATALDANGGVLTGRTVRWTIDATTVATVDAATGVITPVAPGQAVLTATVGGRTGTVGLTVVRAPSPITVSVASGTGSGTVTSAPAGIACTVTAGAASGTCAASLPGDAAVTLTAAPATGSTFVGWSGDCASAGGALTCTLPASSAARTAGVAFAAVQNLSVTLAGAGTGRVTSTPVGIDCQKTTGTCTKGFAQGGSVTLTAAADAGSSFAGWSGEGCTGTGTCVVTMSQARAVTATFTSIPADTITVSAVGPLGLTGTLQPGGTLNGRAITSSVVINLSTSNAAPQFTFYVDPGTQPTLTFTANAGATFTSWGGACTGTATTATCTPTPRSKNDVIVNLAP